MRKGLGVLLLASILYACTLSAENTSWTGAENEYWGITDNWTNGTVGASDNMFLNDTDNTGTFFTIGLGRSDRLALSITIDSATAYEIYHSAPLTAPGAPWSLSFGDVTVLSGTGHEISTPVTYMPASLNSSGTSTWTIADGADMLVSGNLLQNGSETGGLTKEGAGDLYFGGTNTYTGDTLVNDGTLIISSGATDALTATAVTIDIAGQLTFDDTGAGFTYNVASIAGAGGIELGGGIISVGADDSTTTYSGNIIDSIGGGGVEKTGTGIWTLSGTGHSFDALTISDGQVVIDSGSSTVFQNTAVTINVDDGLDRNGLNDLELGGISGSGAFDAGTNLTLNVSGTEVHTGALTLDGSLTKNGTGSQTIANLSDTVSTVTVNAGELAVTGSIFTNIDILIDGTLKANGLLGKQPTGSGTLAANGSLLVGDGTSTDGYNFSGTLEVGAHAVSLLDADLAQLGGTTTLAGGSLTSTNGIELESGETLSGYGTVKNYFLNNGTVDGQNTGLIFEGVVEGAGNFTGDVTFDGVYAPGNSPADVTLENPTFDGVLEIEIGGLVSGTEFDHMSIIGSASLGGVLELAYYNGYVASEGDRFTFLTGSYSGTFDSFTAPDAQDWFIEYGADMITVGVVPEPGIYAAILGLLVVAFAMIKRRRQH